MRKKKLLFKVNSYYLIGSLGVDVSFFRLFILNFSLVCCGSVSLQAMTRPTRTVLIKNPWWSTFTAQGRQFMSDLWPSVPSKSQEMVVEKPEIISVKSINIPWYEEFAQRGIPEVTISQLAEDELFFYKLIMQYRFINDRYESLMQKSEGSNEKQRVIMQLEKLKEDMDHVRKLMESHYAYVRQKQIGFVGQTDLFDSYKRMSDTYPWYISPLRHWSQNISTLKKSIEKENLKNNKVERE